MSTRISDSPQPKIATTPEAKQQHSALHQHAQERQKT